MNDRVKTGMMLATLMGITGGQSPFDSGRRKPREVKKSCLNCGCSFTGDSLFCKDTCKDAFRAMDPREYAHLMKRYKTLDKAKRRQEYKDRMAAQRKQAEARETFLKTGEPK